MKVTKAYQVTHGERVLYVESLPEGRGDYGWTSDITKALNLTDAQAKRFHAYAMKTWGACGRWGVQSYGEAIA